MECLNIPQHEEQRFKVQLGKKIHEKKSHLNKDYLRKKIGCIKKELSVYLSSSQYKIRGILDELLWLEDGTISPLEFKFAKFHERLFSTYKMQLTLQAMLIKENYRKSVNIGFLVFVRSKNYLLKVPIKETDINKANKIVNRILEIIRKGIYPGKTRSASKCVDCCYKNICV
jgi:CRISPR-associated exonuclease Cas4